MAGKAFTLENLREDRACADGLAFVTPIIEAGECVASALLDNCHDDWFQWAIEYGYDVEPARRAWRTWDEQGLVHATAGDYGTATAGYKGTATAGHGGTASVGSYGTATAGSGGTATAGSYGTIAIKHWGGNRCRLVVGYIGEDGLKPNTPYRLDENGKFVEADNA